MRWAWRIQRMWLALALLLAPAIPATLAQPSDDALKQWQDLNGRAISAYRLRKYAEGLNWAEQAFEYAERAFGQRDPNGLTPTLDTLGGPFR
jgi:hypothetical protein